MAKKSKGLRRIKNTGARYPKWAKLDDRAFGGRLNGDYFGFDVSKLGKFHRPVFRSKYAARKYLDLLIGDDEVIWSSDTAMTTHPAALMITGDQLRMLIDYHYKSARVKAWDLPESYKEIAEYMRDDEPYVPPPQKERRSGVSRKGMILVADISEAIGMHPRDARGILRALNYEKPKHGWAWKTKEEADEIKQTLQQSRRKSQQLETNE